MAAVKKKQKTSASAPTLAYKGFDKNLQCRGFQYEIGKDYTHEGPVKACETGFHSCLDPIDVWNYYPPAESRFALVEVSGETSTHEDDSKIASSHIKIKAEISLGEFIKASVDAVVKNCKPSKKKSATQTEKQSLATNTGDRSAATNTGNQSAATNTGDRSAATNTGYRSAATNTGDRSAATNTGYRSAATNTGNQSAATNTGNRSAAQVDGKQSVAIATGYEGKARAAEGSWIVLVERNSNYEILNIKSAQAGKDIKADTWYTLENGNFKEAA